MAQDVSAQVPEQDEPQKDKQLLHLVFGGELESVEDATFQDLSKLDIVGVYPNYASAYAAWKAQGAADGRQRADALLHRPPASPARSARLTPRVR